jgi:hypothetical protein
VSRKQSAAAEMSKRYTGSRVTPPVDLNEIVQYTYPLDQLSKKNCYITATTVP